jgi:hypothetical protein
VRVAATLQTLLLDQAREASARRWLSSQDASAMTTLVCAGDVLPAANGEARIERRAPYLALAPLAG